MNSILYYDGDAIHNFLISSKYNAFMHGANCQATMNSGIAKDVKQKLPELYHADLDYHLLYKPHEKLGKFSHVVYGNDEKSTPHKMAFNLYTQLDYGHTQRHFNYGAFMNAMDSAIQFMIEKGCYEIDNNLLKTIRIVIPKIGCGLGKGDWEIVSELLRHYNFASGYSVVFNVYRI
jgi:O-acetyl-ADP-ribose deacetylase (regulator of RNase III)